MKHSLYIAALLTLVTGLPVSAHAAAERYAFDPAHTNIDWSANHFGFSNPTGKFAQATGTLVLDEAKPAASTVNVTIDMTKLVTGIDKFNEHLKSKDFLDVAQFPTAQFVSKTVKVTGQNTADITGDLTLHGVTKPVTLKTTLNKIGPSVMTKVKTAGFAATTTLKRSEFGISSYVPGVSDEVVLTITAEANLETAKTP